MAAFVIMGVTGCGKTALGRALANRLGLPFVEGDTLHPKANIAKMSAGRALNDADREPFLDNVAQALCAHAGGVVISCSALKRAYRDRLRAAAGRITFVLPLVDRMRLTERITNRLDHFMPLSLLDSQLATLEPLQDDEEGITLDGTEPVPVQLEKILAQP